MRKSLLISLILVGSFTAVTYAMPHKKGSNLLDLSDLVKTGLQLAVKNPDTGVISYNTDGMFLKHNGYFYDSLHNRLQGFTMPDKLLADPCTLTDIKAPVEELEPRATSNAYISLNLNAKDKIPSGPFDDKNPNTYNYTTQVSIFDDIGATHDVIAYYVMNILNDWSVYLKIDGIYVIKGNLLFDANGELSVSSGFDEINFIPAGRQHTQTIKIDYAKTTQLPEVTAIRAISADGYVRANFVEEKVDANGYLSARYSNSQVITFSKIAVYSKS